MKITMLRARNGPVRDGPWIQAGERLDYLMETGCILAPQRPSLQLCRAKHLLELSKHLTAEKGEAERRVLKAEKTLSFARVKA